MLGRLLDDSYPAQVRSNITAVTAGRLVANAAYRYTGPFLGVISRGLDVSLAQIGVALAIGETSGLLSPITARIVDRLGPRRAMWVGLCGVAGAAVLVAAATHLAVFAAAILLLGWSKGIYDIGLGAWIATRVAYARRSRVVGLTETSWALGLLVGVSLMGVITGLSGFRWAYVAIAVAVVAMSGVIRRMLPDDHRRPHDDGGAAPAIGRIGANGLVVVVGMLALAGAAQALFVTFGSWLEDDHGLTSVGLAAVTFGLGAFELVASLTSAHRTDTWGKERSVAAGAAVMVPATILLAVGQHNLLVGLLGVVVAVSLFEFGIVSGIAIAAELVPGSPARGLAWVVSATTIARAVVAIPATRLYQHVGIEGPALLAGALAAAAAGAFVYRSRGLARSAVAVGDR